MNYVKKSVIITSGVLSTPLPMVQILKLAKLTEFLPNLACIHHSFRF